MGITVLVVQHGEKVSSPGDPALTERDTRKLGTVDTLRTLLGDEAVVQADPELIPSGLPNCAITTLAVDRGHVTVGALPDTSHLVGSGHS